MYIVFEILVSFLVFGYSLFLVLESITPQIQKITETVYVDRSFESNKELLERYNKLYLESSSRNLMPFEWDRYSTPKSIQIQRTIVRFQSCKNTVNYYSFMKEGEKNNLLHFAKKQIAEHAFDLYIKENPFLLSEIISNDRIELNLLVPSFVRS